MSKRKKAKCPHPQCEGGFIIERTAMVVNGQARTYEQRHLCPICNGLTKVRNKR